MNPEQIMLESDGMIIYLKGEIREETYYDGTINLILPIIAVNNGELTTTASIEKFCINGWEVESYNSIELDGGKKAKNEFKIEDVYGKTDITSIADITDIEFYGSISRDYRYVTKNLRYTIVFK